ncbi:hypothetical protein IU427_32825 [Nocardia beijingensis]|uniref:hypothetical protein n=1 Tax=Nocardia beijingensis TaxID=95162 RepID=UPI001895F6D7|nr:hypothetical protein [Nocardia beijingensis]MBF6469909.1 hypothetical protein [Nocardia beijingensis]
MIHTPQPWPPHGAPASSPAGQRPVRTWDVVLAIVLYCVAAVLGSAAAYFTLFFAFATDPCGTDNCRTDYLGWAFAVSWGGTALAIVGVTGMLILAAVKRWYMWYWPVLAIVLIVLSFAGGLALTSQVYTGS